MAQASTNHPLAIVLTAVTAVAACASPLPDWDGRAADPDAAALEARPEVELFFDPPARSDAVARVTHLTLALAGAPRVVLVEGALTSSQLRDLARPVLPQTLAARARPALVWTMPGTGVAIAPLEPLVAGGLYTVGVGDPPLALPFMVEPVDAVPMLARVWPDPADEARAAATAVWCGADALGEVDTPVTLGPALVVGRLARGTGATIAAPHCLSWTGLDVPAPAAIAEHPAVTPASVIFRDGTAALLEPTLLWPAVQVAEPEPTICGATEVPFGPGCAVVEDDRVVVRPPEGPVLWTIGAESRAEVRSSRSGRRFVLRPIPSDGLYRVASLDESSRRAETSVVVTPARPKSHVVLNEVMANPAGREPDQEWIELFNDGRSAVSLGGYTLETSGKLAILPDQVLGEGAFALVVADDYVEGDGLDPVAAPGTLLVRVPALGRGGLSNEGQRLVLRDAAGDVVSTFPAMKTKNGVSNARVRPDAFDAEPDSFAPSVNGSATPGAPNGLR